MNRIVVLLAGVVGVVSLFVMAGWIFDIDFLKRIVPGFVTMKFSTALSFFLGGGILFVIALKEHRERGWIDIVLPSSVLLISILMGTQLLSVLFQFRSGLESFLIEDRTNAILTAVPGQPSIGTMLAFVLSVVLGLISMSYWHKRRLAYFTLGLLIAVLGGIALIGYVVSQPVLYYAIEGMSSAMAVHTAILFVLLGVGYMFLRPRKLETS